jgi:hypothetical protein
MSDDAAMDWWEQRRLKYNLGLVISGLLAFASYVGVVDRCISSGAMPDAEITLFTTAFQAVGYLLMMGLANLCYFAGAFIEARFVEQPKVERYRRVAFGFGFWFSVLLPFMIPALVGLQCLIRLR